MVNLFDYKKSIYSAIGNDGIIYNTKHNSMNQPTLIQWEHKRKEIESKCGSIEELPTTPEEVPNFLPASSTPPVSYSQNLSSQNDDYSNTDTETEEPKGTNWLLIGGLAIGAYFLID